MRHCGGTINGIYRDRLVGPHGQVIHDSGWNSNMIMDDFRTLLARFVRHDDKVLKQGHRSIVFKVGPGLSAWDKMPQLPPASEGLMTPPAEVVTEVLEGTKDLIVAYLGENDPDVPSNRVQITAFLNPGVPPAPVGGITPLREFAVCMRLTAPDKKVTDWMINCVYHKVIHKAAEDTLIREIRFTF